MKKPPKQRLTRCYKLPNRRVTIGLQPDELAAVNVLLTRLLTPAEAEAMAPFAPAGHPVLALRGRVLETRLGLSLDALARLAHFYQHLPEPA